MPGNGCEYFPLQGQKSPFRELGLPEVIGDRGSELGETVIVAVDFPRRPLAPLRFDFLLDVGRLQ